jgi:hypothetical protein
MKISKKIYSILVIVFSIATMCLAALAILHYVGTDIMMISLGVTQIIAGLSQISMSKDVDSQGKSKGNKKVGRFSIIVGVVIIIAVILKWLAII